MAWYMYLIYSIVGFLAILVILILVLIIYAKLTAGKCKSNVSLHGKTTIITGANTGIGYETAVDFAKRGAKVILACRSPKTGKEAEQSIIRKTTNSKIFFKPLDLSSVKSVRQFVEEINKTEERLDILVNNAGAVGLPHETTEDGMSLLMQTNYFGPVLLTELLLDLLKKTPNSRIVNVSSRAGDYVKNFDVDNLNQIPDGKMKDFKYYARSKLCNILYTIKLAERLKETSVTTYSLNPGVVLTTINRNQGVLIGTVSRKIAGLFGKSPRGGAQTTIYCSLAEGIEKLSGKHFEDCHLVKRYKTARDPDLPDKLWQITENILKLNQV